MWFCWHLLMLVAVEPETAPLDFDTQVAPIFTRFGCNSGACHGSAAGRGGFKLSLYGSSPAADYDAIALQLRHRRVNLTHPERSLVLLKPTGQSDHEGDVRFSENSPAAERLLTWIRQGANRNGQRSLRSLTISTSQHFVSHPNDTVKLSAVAEFSDGTRDDVTEWTVFTPDDVASVGVDASATATVRRYGRHIVIARFLDQVRPVELILPYAGEAPETPTERSDGLIDRHIAQRLVELGLPPSPICDDATFVRRVWLDLTGRLPDPAAAIAFVNNANADKREALIDELLASDDFVDFWTLRIAKLLRVAELRDREAAVAWRTWIHACLTSRVSWNDMVRQLVMAEGSIHEPGPAPFFLVGGDPRAQSEFLTEALMGLRLRCANCHDHPLDQWTQDDYHGLTAVFAGIQKGEAIGFDPRGTVIHPGTGLPAVPRIPGERYLEEGNDSRIVLSRWMTSDENPCVATAVTNRVWSWLMGRGLVEPVDDLRVTNPATHPELLTELSQKFAANNGDLRLLVREICLSDAWQRSSVPNRSNRADDAFYSHARSRPLLPEVLLDAICDVTGVLDDPDADGDSVRAVTQRDPGFESESLEILGRCEAGQACTTPELSQGLPNALAFINGPVINTKLRNSKGRLRTLIGWGTPDQELIRTFYLLTYSRVPSDAELSAWQTAFKSAADEDERAAIAEDFVWSLMSSDEFRTNH